MRVFRAREIPPGGRDLLTRAWEGGSFSRFAHNFEKSAFSFPDPVEMGFTGSNSGGNNEGRDWSTHPHEAATRAMLPVKMNLAPDIEGLGFLIDEMGAVVCEGRMRERTLEAVAEALRC